MSKASIRCGRNIRYVATHRRAPIQVQVALEAGLSSVDENADNIVTDAEDVFSAVQLLRGDFQEVAKRMSDGKYSLWLGSGISRSRMPMLQDVMLQLLTFLQYEIASGDAAKYGPVLEDVLSACGASQAVVAAIDSSQDPALWDDIAVITEAMASNYARILDVQVDSFPADHLLWDGTNFVDTFADEVPIDSEHLCIAVLTLEGVADELVSANWDGLIEKAVRRLDPRSSALKVRVLPSDFRGDPGRPQLLKFHGCAIKAKERPGRYRDSLVGRLSQIERWTIAGENRVMKQEMVQIICSRPVLLLGLSAQDVDIRLVFMEAVEAQPLDWAEDAGSLIVAEPRLGTFQIDVLRQVYGESYGGNAVAIRESSAFPTFARPLLAALVIDVLAKKLIASLGTGKLSHFEPVQVTAVGQHLEVLKDDIARYCEQGQFVKVVTVIGLFTQLTNLARSGRILPPSRIPYTPMSPGPVSDIGPNNNTTPPETSHLALVLAVLWSGHSGGDWVVGANHLHSRGYLSVTRGGRVSKVFIAASEEAAIDMQKHGLVDSSDQSAILIGPGRATTPRTRSPSATHGRTGRGSMRAVGFRDLIDGAKSDYELRQNFRKGATL